MKILSLSLFISPFLHDEASWKEERMKIGFAKERRCKYRNIRCYGDVR